MVNIKSPYLLAQQGPWVPNMHCLAAQEEAQLCQESNKRGAQREIREVVR